MSEAPPTVAPLTGGALALPVNAPLTSCGAVDQPLSVLSIAFEAMVLGLLARPWFGFSAPWQLVRSTAFTIITFLIVQTSQKRAMTAVAQAR